MPRRAEGVGEGAKARAPSGSGGGWGGRAGSGNRGGAGGQRCGGKRVGARRMRGGGMAAAGRGAGGGARGGSSTLGLDRWREQRVREQRRRRGAGTRPGWPRHGHAVFPLETVHESGKSQRGGQGVELERLRGMSCGGVLAYWKRPPPSTPAFLICIQRSPAPTTGALVPHKCGGIRAARTVPSWTVGE